MNQIEISGSGIGGSVTVEDKKRSSDPLLSGNKKKPRSSDPPPPLSEGQLQKIYDVKKIAVDSKEGYYTGPFNDFVPTGNPTYVYAVVCKVCECPFFTTEFYPSFREDSNHYDILQRHAIKHIKSGFINHDGVRLRDEIPVEKGYERICKYCGCGFKRCGSGSYYTAQQFCGYCDQLGKHSSEECPQRDENVKVDSPCCSP